MGNYIATTNMLNSVMNAANSQFELAHYFWFLLNLYVDFFEKKSRTVSLENIEKSVSMRARTVHPINHPGIALGCL